MRYDLVVIGSDPAGQWGAIAAARLNKRVALVERSRLEPQGLCLYSGTISTRIMREAIVHLTDIQQREAFGERFREKPKITMHDIRRQVTRIAELELDVMRSQLDWNGVDRYCGGARFTGPHAVVVENPAETTRLEANRVVIASGTKPARPENIHFDGTRIFDADEILKLETIPRSLTVVGGGVSGLEYATLFATLGARVTVIDGRDRLLEFCDREIVKTLLSHCRSRGMVFHLGEDVIAIDKKQDDRIVLLLESGKRLFGESVLFTAGRIGDTADLNLPAAGLEPDNRGRLWCDANFRTWVPHIYGVGDVVGFPARAGDSIEQGRRAIGHAFAAPLPGRQPMSYAVNTIPEIAMVGRAERQLMKEHIPYEVGIARLGEIGHSPILEDKPGLLKLLFHRATHKLLGVHCIGEKATEIVQMGQSVMAADGTIDCFSETAFDNSAMAEYYKVATIDGLNRLDLDEQFEPADELEAQVAEQPRDSIAEVAAV